MVRRLKCCALLGAVLLTISTAGYAQSGDRDRRSGQPSIGERVDDTVLNSKVRAALMRERSLGSGNVWVKADSGTVVLGGSVDSAEEKRKAETVARSVDGVKTVKNELQVK
jgi:osmotically-inducible protein OsmY